MLVTGLLTSLTNSLPEGADELASRVAAGAGVGAGADCADADVAQAIAVTKAKSVADIFLGNKLPMPAGGRALMCSWTLTAVLSLRKPVSLFPQALGCFATSRAVLAKRPGNPVSGRPSRTWRQASSSDSIAARDGFVSSLLSLSHRTTSRFWPSHSIERAYCGLRYWLTMLSRGLAAGSDRQAHHGRRGFSGPSSSLFAIRLSGNRSGFISSKRLYNELSLSIPWRQHRM